MENIRKRISRQQMYIDIVQVVAKRSTCPRKQVGAILVKDKRVIAMGYNGVLPGVDPIMGINPISKESQTVHAEANLIAFCAREGIATEGCDLYISLSPCIKCTELIVQAGIKRVFYLEEYRDDKAFQILNQQNIDICPVTTK